MLCSNLQKQLLETGNAELLVNYLAAAIDTLSSHVLDRSLGLLYDDKKAMDWHITSNTIAILTPLMKQYTWIIPIALEIPVLFLEKVWPSLARIVALNNVSLNVVLDYLLFITEGFGLQKEQTLTYFQRIYTTKQKMPFVGT